MGLFVAPPDHIGVDYFNSVNGALFRGIMRIRREDGRLYDIPIEHTTLAYDKTAQFIPPVPIPVKGEVVGFTIYNNEQVASVKRGQLWMTAGVLKGGLGTTLGFTLMEGYVSDMHDLNLGDMGDSLDGKGHMRVLTLVSSAAAGTQTINLRPDANSRWRVVMALGYHDDPAARVCNWQFYDGTTTHACRAVSINANFMLAPNVGDTDAYPNIIDSDLVLTRDVYLQFKCASLAAAKKCYFKAVVEEWLED